jgi:hypothetical protein
MPLSNDVAEYIKNLEFIARCAGECSVDIGHQRAGRPIYYNVDFGLLCPVLFAMPGPGSKEFLAPPIESTRRVLGKKPAEGGFELVVSGPTIIEFFDQLNHTLHGLQRQALILKEIPRKYSLADEASLRTALITSDELRRDLVQLTQKDLDQRVRTPIKALLALLKHNALRGTADVLDIEALRHLSNNDQFKIFLKEQLATRLKNERRDTSDSEFHYKIDAANNCLTLATVRAHGPEALFVTPTGLNRRQCTVGHRTYARSDRTPLFMLNASRLRDMGHIRDELHFVEETGRKALDLVQQLRNYKDLGECPGHLQLELASFYENYVSFISRVDDKKPQVELDNFEEMMESVFRKGHAEQLLQDATSDLRDGARLIERHAAELVDLSYLDEFELDDDPVLESMRRRLGVLKAVD